MRVRYMFLGPTYVAGNKASQGVTQPSNACPEDLAGLVTQLNSLVMMQLPGWAGVGRQRPRGGVGLEQMGNMSWLTHP